VPSLIGAVAAVGIFFLVTADIAVRRMSLSEESSSLDDESTRLTGIILLSISLANLGFAVGLDLTVLAFDNCALAVDFINGLDFFNARRFTSSPDNSDE
jgi:hypothetical protein